MEKVISIVGAGGKTTLVHKLAREYHRGGKGVLVTTTTHMYVELTLTYPAIFLR